MARLKRVFRNASEVAHVWAQRSQDEGRSSNCFFEGDTIYSYGRHFPIARFIERNNEVAVLFTTRTYSVTTAKHLGFVRDALRGLDYPVFDVPAPTDSPREEEILSYYQRNINRCVQLAGKARKLGDHHLATAQDYFNRYTEIAEFFGFKKQIELNAATIADAKAAVKRQNELKKAAAAKAEFELANTEIINAQLIQIWRECGEPPTGVVWQGPRVQRTLLRVKGDEIETSRGAFVPLKQAVRLWPIIRNCREKGNAASQGKIGHYQITGIDKQGNATIGCHFIEYREFEMIAKQLGIFDLDYPEIVRKFNLLEKRT